MIIDGTVAINQHFGTQIRVVGPLGAQQCREWVDRQEKPDEWVVLTIETVGTVNEWESLLLEETGMLIFDYDGFSDWREEWPMTRAEFDRRLTKCTLLRQRSK